MGWKHFGIVTVMLVGLTSTEASAQVFEPPSNAPIDVDADGAAAPVDQAKMDEDTRAGLFIASAVTFGVGYLTPIIIGAPYGYADQGGWMFVPVAGPIVTIAARSGCNAVGERACTTADNFIAPGLVAASVFQLAGVGMLLGGLLYESKPDGPVEVNPMFDTSSVGLVVRGVW